MELKGCDVGGSKINNLTNEGGITAAKPFEMANEGEKLDGILFSVMEENKRILKITNNEDIFSASAVNGFANRLISKLETENEQFRNGDKEAKFHESFEFDNIRSALNFFITKQVDIKAAMERKNKASENILENEEVKNAFKNLGLEISQIPSSDEEVDKLLAARRAYLDNQIRMELKSGKIKGGTSPDDVRKAKEAAQLIKEKLPQIVAFKNRGK